MRREEREERSGGQLERVGRASCDEQRLTGEHSRKEGTYDGGKDEGRSGHGREISRDIGETARSRAGEGGGNREGNQTREGRESEEVNFLCSNQHTLRASSLADEPLDERSPGSL